MSTPGKPRQSGIPGRVSSIPTPGRSRSSSTVNQTAGAMMQSSDISRAFADAIKANDPAQHRIITPANSTSNSTLSPRSIPLLQSGRQSTSGRPSSAASSSSAISFMAHPLERAKTPVSTRPPSRPPSRHSDVYQSGKYPIRLFEVGENVRIESLGFEGVLRYLGEIEGKPGLWAGVELSGGFSGKGKNKGIVNGKQYFICPDNCGVFVAATKLSPPTVGPTPTCRPSSVASSRSGRMTPASTGRATPSFVSSASTSKVIVSTSNYGRITPSTSSRRLTQARQVPTVTTPSSKSRPSVPGAVFLTEKLTAGSRASKYRTLTARDLTWQAVETSPQRSISPSSPMFPSSPQATRLPPSPTRLPGSPFSTPKAPSDGRTPIFVLSSGKGRASGSTPRARIPSAVAMPPPASPISQEKVLFNGDSDTDVAGIIHDDDLSKLSFPGRSVLVATKDVSRPGSSISSLSPTPDDTDLLIRFQSRLDALEYENERLRTTTLDANQTTSHQVELNMLKEAHSQAITQIARLQDDLAEATSLSGSRIEEIASLKSKMEALNLGHGANMRQVEDHSSELQRELGNIIDQLRQSQNALGSKEKLCLQKEAILNSKDAEIASLKFTLNNALSDLEEEKQQLGAQIDELRIAGQETIALYEERLSNADDQRYDLECRLMSLEKGLTGEPSSPSLTTPTASATQIDNETLRDQVLHLQKKITVMEDIIEDGRATSEKDEAALRERMRRLKDKEETMKKELGEGRKEVERMSKCESSARSRVEEIGEALRESTVALDNARAEIETLRAELTNLDNLIEGNSNSDVSSRLAEFIQHVSADREQTEKELARLTILLEASPQGAVSMTPDQGATAKLKQENGALNSALSRMATELEERNSDIERLKILLQNSSMNGNQDSCKPMPPQSTAKIEMPSNAKEELTGLKHIVLELQKENSAATQKTKLLESENQFLRSEAEQLRQPKEVRLLEDNLEGNLLKEGMESGEHIVSQNPNDPGSLQQKLKGRSIRMETESEQLRKRIADSDIKHARIIHDLNKEISELEALVESKIYREDELEQEVERLKDKLTRYKKSSETSNEATERHRLSSASSNTASSDVSGLCEICERPGHDIFNCDLLREDVGMGRSSGESFCEDCEGYGHVAANCPHSQDVF